MASEWFSYHLHSGVIFTPLIEALCIGLVRRSVTQTSIRYESHSIPTRGGGGVLDQILDGDVPSRCQKHTRSFYQFFQNSYPTLYHFFKNIYPTLYQFSENAYPTLCQFRELRKLIPFLIPKSWKSIPFPMARPRTQNMYSTPPPPGIPIASDTVKVLYVGAVEQAKRYYKLLKSLSNHIPRDLR